MEYIINELMSQIQSIIFGSIFSFLVILFLIDDAEAIDLEPVNFTMNPTYPVTGETIEISFEVINNDAFPANDVDIVVWNSTSECDVDDECVPIFETTVASIAQNKKAEIQFNCSPDGPDGCGGTGERVLTVFADYTDETSETNENNNKIIHVFEIFAQPYPNLRGVEGDFTIVLDEGNPTVGDSVDVLAMFQNSGRDKTEGDFSLHFKETINGLTQTIELVELRFSVAEGDVVPYNVTWIPDEVGEYTIEVFLDSEDDLDELKEDDNILTTSVNVREHTPELTLDESRGIHVESEEYWLEEIYSNHTVTFTIHVLNQDYAITAEDVLVSFYDLPEGGVEKHIGDYTIPSIVNGTRVSEDQIIPGTEPAYISWSKDTGTSILGDHTIIIRIDSNDGISELKEDDNNFTFDFKVLESKADLTIFDIYVVGEPVRGIPSDIIINVFNKGSKEFTSCNIQFRVDGNIINSWQVSLDEGEFINITSQYTWNEQQPTIGGYADMDDNCDELVESNNIKSTVIDVAAPGYDLSLLSVKSSAPVFKGEFIRFLVTIKNNLAFIPDLRLSVYIDNSSSPVSQGKDKEGNLTYYIYQKDLAYNETRPVDVFWNTTVIPGLFNVTIKAEIYKSGFDDFNLSDNTINTTVLIKPKSYQLSVEMQDLPDQIFFNETLQITVSAFNFGPEICCECPENLSNMTNATVECRGGAEIALYINGKLLEAYPDHIYLTKPLARAIGEEVHVFYWTPDALGSYKLEIRIDPDNIIDEYNELDNIAYEEVNVILGDTVVIEPEAAEEEDSLINNPLVWLPLIVLSLAGAGMFAYSRLGDGGDYLDYYDDESSSINNIESASKQSGFRYDPETGETYDSQTGEVIDSNRKKD